MSGFSNLTVQGRLGKDPELKELGGGKCVGNFSIAFDQGWGDNKTTIWLSVTVWNKTANFVFDNFKKGDGILVIGELKQDEWVDKESGQTRKAIKMVGNRVVFPMGNTNTNSYAAGDVAKADEMPF